MAVRNSKSIVFDNVPTEQNLAPLYYEEILVWADFSETDDVAITFTGSGDPENEDGELLPGQSVLVQSGTGIYADRTVTA